MKTRVLEPEIMDQPGLDPGEHRRALAGLRRLNGLGRGTGEVWSALVDLLPPTDAPPLRVLDVASGGGDVPIGIARRATRRRAPLRIDACDLSATAVSFAQSCAPSTGAVRFLQLDALARPFPDRYDVVTCSLFLHHLPDDDVVSLLTKMREAATRRIVVSDLERGRVNLALVHAATRLVTRSHVVHVDGPRSVRAAFTRGELADLARRAGLDGAIVRRRHPCRLRLVWSRS